jgi:hypothetical protein
MKLQVRSTLILMALVTTIGVSVFAAACGSSSNETTTTAAAATTLAPTTTVASSSATSGTMTVKGMVDNPIALTVDELKKMTVVDITATHPKLGEQQYSGVRLSDLLATLKVQAAATVVDLGCSDGYMAEVAIADINKSPDSMIAIGEDGTLNSVMPGMTGKAWAKDIISMEFK